MLCKAPWNHIQINAEGNINPCCMFSPTIYHKKYKNLQEAFDGQENQNLRQKMLNGETIRGCHKCNLYDKLDKFSYRDHFNQKYSSETISDPKIRELELSLDNTCNFKCVTCSSRFSSKWYKDDIILNHYGFNRVSNSIEYGKNVIANDINITDLDLSELNYLKIIGGEPFINIKYLNIIKTLNLSNLRLALITNNSVFPKKWLEFILNVKKLDLHISLDGVYDVGEFVRYGMNFEKFTKNLLKWKEISEKHPNVNICFNFVVHSLNVLNLKSTKKYLENLGFIIDVEHIRDEKLEIDFLREPFYLNISHLPKKTKEIISDSLDFSLNGKTQMIKEFMYSDDMRFDSMKKFIQYSIFLGQRRDLPNESEIIFNSVFENL